MLNFKRFLIKENLGDRGELEDYTHLSDSLSKHYNSKDYSKREKAALNEYTGNDISSAGLNKAMLKNHRSSIPTDDLESFHKEIHDYLKSAINKSKPLEHPLTTYSGTGEWNIGEHLKQPGDVIHTPAFTSTSLDPFIANNFVNRKIILPPNDHKISIIHDHLLRIHLPKGYNKGMYISHMVDATDLGNEHEYLLSPNQKWKLQKHTHKVKYEHNSTRTHTDEIHTHVYDVEPYED